MSKVARKWKSRDYGPDDDKKHDYLLLILVR